MRRRLFHLVAALSLISTITLVVVWVRSHWISDSILWVDTNASGWDFDSPVYANVAQVDVYPGSVWVSWRRNDSEAPFGGWLAPGFFHDASLSESSNGADEDVLDDRASIAASGLGFAVEVLDLDWTRRWAIKMPLWFVTSLAALPALTWLYKKRVNRSGHCPTCGYDLRATPERCPECGTSAPASTPASS